MSLFPVSAYLSCHQHDDTVMIFPLPLLSSFLSYLANLPSCLSLQLWTEVPQVMTSEPPISFFSAAFLSA
jgi:hypothetical protein